MNLDTQQPGNSPLPKQDLFMSPSLPPEIQPSQPKSKRKLVFIMAGAVVLLLIGLTVFAMTRPNQKVQQPVQQQANTQDTAKQYLLAIQNSEYEKAYDYYGDDLKKQTSKTAFVTVIGPGIHDSLKLSECVFSKISEETELETLKIACPNKEGNTSIMTMAITKNGKQKIHQIGWNNE